MSKAKQKSKVSQLKRRKAVEEVFKKGKKQREIAKKFDEKIAQKQGSCKARDKFQQFKNEKKRDGQNNRNKVEELNKKFDAIRANRKPGQGI